jgi:Ser/Thr protein kinase RdoA (MazF antagonist)
MTDLDHPAPSFSTDQAQALARDLYGIEGSVSRLNSERDQNFKLVSGQGDWTLKIVNASEPVLESEFQTALLEHLERMRPDTAVPRLQKAKDTRALAEVWADSGERHAVRLVSWLAGKPLAESARTPEVLHSLGRALGRLDRALQGFIHPGALRELDWDIRRAGEARARLHHVRDEADRALLARLLDRFDAETAPTCSACARR